MKRSYQSLVVLFLLLVVNIVASLMIGTPFIPFDQLAVSREWFGNPRVDCL